MNMSRTPFSRYQLAATAYKAEKDHDFGQSWTENFDDESENYKATYYAIADAILALIEGNTRD